MSEPAVFVPTADFLAEENPFEAMMERFDHAAKLLNLDGGCTSAPQSRKQIIVSIPSLRDNGEVEVYTATGAVQHGRVAPQGRHPASIST